MANNFKNAFVQRAMETTTIHSIADGKNQLRTDEVINLYPNGVTITAFDVVKTEDKEFSILLFKENENAFFYGGTVLTNLCKAWLQMTGLNCAETSVMLADEGGVTVKLSKALGKNKMIYTKVDIIQ